MESDLTGVGLIANERTRQIKSEGWSAQHDDQHVSGELAEAAVCYVKRRDATHSDGTPFGWPWDHKWWKPTMRIRNLVKAGALIAAEIDRLLRVDTKGA